MRQHEMLSKGRGTTAEELKALCSLYMADDYGDDSVLRKDDDGEDEMIRDWLDTQARAHGYDSWLVAYHRIGVSREDDMDQRIAVAVLADFTDLGGKSPDPFPPLTTKDYTWFGEDG